LFGVALTGTGTTGEEMGKNLSKVDSLGVCESVARNVQSSILRGHKDYSTVTLVADPGELTEPKGAPTTLWWLDRERSCGRDW
jgi:hypothetical protein